MAGVRVTQTSRIPEPTQVDSPKVKDYLNRLIQTLRNNFNSSDLRLSTINRSEHDYTNVATTPYDVAKTDFILLCDSTVGNITLNLPPADIMFQKIVIIKKTTTDANTLIIDPSGAELIDLSATYTIPGVLLGHIKILSDGVQWWII